MVSITESPDRGSKFLYSEVLYVKPLLMPRFLFTSIPPFKKNFL
jgi:hypothetical protein